MSKYEVIKYNLYVLAVVAIIYAATAFVLCCFPWGSYGWMGRLDYRKLNPKEAQQYFVKHQLKKDIKIEIFGRTYKVDAGTNIQIQGWYTRLPESEGKNEAWFVQTEDGRRGLCRSDELNDVITKHHIAVYDHARQDDDWIYFHTIADENKIDELIERHVSFEYFDSIFGPTINATTGVKSGRFLVGYRGIDYSYNGNLSEGMIASFINNELDSVQSLTKNNAWCPNWLASFASNWMEHSAAHISPGYYKLTKGYGPLQASFYPYKWLARGIMGIFDILFAFLVNAVVSSILFFLFLENKARSNTFIGLAIILICGVAYSLYFYYTMELSPNLFCYGYATLTMLFISMSLNNRCPKCRSLVEMEKIGTSYGEVKERVYNTYSTNDTTVNEWSDFFSEGTVVDREYIKERLVEKHQLVTKHYRCPKCGYTYESSNDKTISQKWIKRITGVDRITTTKTWTY